MAFTNFWTRKGFELRQPEFPLVAIVFADKQSYLKFSRPDLGEAGESIIGYFGLTSNRMTMYDLTGVEAQGRGPGRNRTAAQINQILAQPEASRTVATIIHEATHQIAFNCGLHTRLSDCPLWFSEGIAEYFETPDLRSAKGWKGVGRNDVNPPRLDQFQQYLAARPADSLETLLARRHAVPRFEAEPRRLRRGLGVDVLLIRQHPKEYVAYLAMLSKKKPLRQDDAEKRVDEFRRAFGELDAVDAEFLALHGSGSVKHVPSPFGRELAWIIHGSIRTRVPARAAQGVILACASGWYGDRAASSPCVMNNPG